jgi:hypothetical protein
MDLETFHYYTRWHESANERAYNAPADPWEPIRVSPANVQQYTTNLRLNWGLGRVQSGDWDSGDSCDAIRETPTYRGLAQRFDEGRDWAETDLVERARERFEDGESFRGYESLAAFRNVRCSYLDDLYESIANEGYRANREAAHEPASGENPFEDAYAHQLEPLVVVGRDGTIYWSEGFHRFAIADVLSLDEIPVQVLCRHEQWQAVRDAVSEAAGDGGGHSVDVARDHPDLQDVV